MTRVSKWMAVSFAAVYTVQAIFWTVQNARRHTLEPIPPAAVSVEIIRERRLSGLLPGIGFIDLFNPEGFTARFRWEGLVREIQIDLISDLNVNDLTADLERGKCVVREIGSGVEVVTFE